MNPSLFFIQIMGFPGGQESCIFLSDNQMLEIIDSYLKA